MGGKGGDLGGQVGWGTVLGRVVRHSFGYGEGVCGMVWKWRRDKWHVFCDSERVGLGPLERCLHDSMEI